ncbi:Aste57867_12211 [Aphanomyces stellatus]|uniref:Aste57867_12211 protein n=1 Tax=Aphanomyces stellatus TaxID=120398 RepID=A0A485KVR2_9STRA|nr:hypothetical protein As57867_012166 [Aphanomyces stellatus]VFT89065.1 Aste57867_12211 [Aphanomyces stellatus]
MNPAATDNQEAQAQHVRDKYMERSAKSDTSCQALSRFAQLLLLDNQADEAAPLFDASMKQCPHHLDLKTSLDDYDGCLNTLAHYAFFVENHRNRLDEAKAVYERVLVHRPQHVHALGNYAMLLHKINAPGTRDVIQQAYEASVGRYPSHGAVLCKYAGWLVQENQLDQATKRFVQAAEASPTSPDVLGNFAMFLHAIQGDMDKAEATYLRAIQLDPLHANNLGNYAFFLGAVRRSPVEAEIYYKRSLTANRSGANIWFNYGMLLWRELKQSDHATQCFKNALALDPTHATAAVTLQRKLWNEYMLEPLIYN